MSVFRRITATLSAQVDRLVGEIENHDAIVESGIRENRRALAKAKVRLARIHEEGERMHRRLDGLVRDVGIWRGRAAAGEDEERAIECLRRSKSAASQAETLERSLAGHLEVEQRLTREVESVRARVEAMEHRRSLMRSREATADAAARIRESETGTTLDLDETFERWEIRVTEAELDGGSASPIDGFESGFIAEEERSALRRELAELKRAGEGRHEDR